MLALVERGGGEEMVEVLRSLSEVSARAGRCRDALDFAGRAIMIAQETGLSPGPTWYNGAVAELAGGSIARAAAYAERGIRASEQERDAIYLGRNLHALGQAQLRAGDTGSGVETLRRVRDLEAAQGVASRRCCVGTAISRPAWWRSASWPRRRRRSRAAREAIAHRTRNAGVTARLDRAEALLRAERGEVDAAVEPARRRRPAGSSCSAQPIERGHTLLVLGQVERRRRRYAAARAAVGEALAHVHPVGGQAVGRTGRPHAGPGRRCGRPEPLAGVADRRADGDARLSRHADRDRGSDRHHGARGRQQSRDRDPDVPERQDGRGDADADLPQASAFARAPSSAPGSG